MTSKYCAGLLALIYKPPGSVGTLDTAEFKKLFEEKGCDTSKMKIVHFDRVVRLISEKSLKRFFKYCTIDDMPYRSRVFDCDNFAMCSAASMSLWQRSSDKGPNAGCPVAVVTIKGHALCVAFVGKVQYEEPFVFGLSKPIVVPEAVFFEPQTNKIKNLAGEKIYDVIAF